MECTDGSTELWRPPFVYNKFLWLLCSALREKKTLTVFYSFKIVAPDDERLYVVEEKKNRNFHRKRKQSAAAEQQQQQDINIKEINKIRLFYLKRRRLKQPAAITLMKLRKMKNWLKIVVPTKFSRKKSFDKPKVSDEAKRWNMLPQVSQTSNATIGLKRYYLL